MKPEFMIYGFWALAALVAANFLYQAKKNRGLKGAIFGAPITRTVGELDLGKSGPMHTTLKLHHLGSREPGAPTVGIEVVNRSIASYHMFPIRLTAEQAAALRELLSQAAASS
ncbi:MAG TPA: hypothetical protein VN822_13520 [Candidatus Acidoferrales bacterium]|nr:hypothetical protein [Candidatus Acidoferrales bacterium]